MRKCGKCGETGHNARTCGEVSTKRASQATIKPAGGRKCGKCGDYGHNARTCPQPAVQAADTIEEEEGEEGEQIRPIQRNVNKIAVDASPPTPIVLRVKSVDKIKLPAEERRARAREGQDMVRYSRLMTVARCERWVRRNHDLKVRMVVKQDIEVGQEIGLVETRNREPIAFTKAKIMKIDGKRVFYKVNRDSTSYNTDFDYILNYRVPGRSMYYVTY